MGSARRTTDDFKVLTSDFDDEDTSPRRVVESATAGRIRETPTDNDLTDLAFVYREEPIPAAPLPFELRAFRDVGVRAADDASSSSERIDTSDLMEMIIPGDWVALRNRSRAVYGDGGVDGETFPKAAPSKLASVPVTTPILFPPADAVSAPQRETEPLSLKPPASTPIGAAPQAQPVSSGRSLLSPHVIGWIAGFIGIGLLMAAWLLGAE